jgi:hypothetical protein
MIQRGLIFLVLVCCLAAPIFAQEPVLSQGDIDRFLITFPIITEDLSSLGLEMEETDGGFSLPQAVFMSAQAESIFVKHGWSGDFFPKIELILYGLTLTHLETEMLGAMPDIQASLDEIDTMPVSAYFTVEMKQEMRDMMLMAVQGMNSALFEEMDAIAPKDMDLIRQNKAALSSALNIY